MLYCHNSHRPPVFLSLCSRWGIAIKAYAYPHPSFLRSTGLFSPRLGGLSLLHGVEMIDGELVHVEEAFDAIGEALLLAAIELVALDVIGRDALLPARVCELVGSSLYHMSLLGMREEGLEFGFVGVVQLVEAEVLGRRVHVSLAPMLVHSDVFYAIECTCNL